MRRIRFSYLRDNYLLPWNKRSAQQAGCRRRKKVALEPHRWRVPLRGNRQYGADDQVHNFEDKMDNNIAKCGCNCTNCPTYKENLKSIDDKKRCSAGWEKYLSIRLSPDKLRLCDGCNLPDKKRKVHYLNCSIRKCATRNGVENCAYCSFFPCDEVLNVHSIQRPNSREDIENRIGFAIPEEDYLTFIEPYEGIKHLNEIRHSLNTENIVEMIPFSAHPRIVPFPQDLSVSYKERFPYQLIHHILSSLGVSKNVPYARYLVLVKNRTQLLRLLWALGRFGEIREEQGLYIILDSKNYLDQKITSDFSRVQDHFQSLEKYGIRCEIVPIKGKKWLTPGGALRKEGWFMKMQFTKSMDNDSIIKALKYYTTQLNNKYEKTAFKYFSKADMREIMNVAS